MQSAKHIVFLIITFAPRELLTLSAELELSLVADRKIKTQTQITVDVYHIVWNVQHLYRALEVTLSRYHFNWVEVINILYVVS